MSDLLKLENVGKDYGTFSLQDISFTLPAGCIMGFIGENGAGKSTTIKLILDLIRKDRGSVEIFGKKSEQLPRTMREHIGVVLDEANFSQDLNYKDINMIMKHLYKTWDSRKFFKMMQDYKIPPESKFKDYSKGMKMKFIQDETKSVFISSHILSDLEKICDYITFIHQGRLVFSESKDELLEKYGILKCSEKELADIDEEAVVGVRRNAFGVEALVQRDRIPGGYIVDPATLDEIMVFYVKEAK